MINIMFVCHGNICRSPMAEFVMSDLVCKHGRSDDFNITSAATSYEEIGNPIHRATAKKLADKGIPFHNRKAVRLKIDDYKKYDLIIGMDGTNIQRILQIVGSDPCGKVKKLLDFSGGGDIEDPWYTGDFDTTYDDIIKGCKALLSKLI